MHSPNNSLQNHAITLSDLIFYFFFSLSTLIGHTDFSIPIVTQVTFTLAL